MSINTQNAEKLPQIAIPPNRSFADKNCIVGRTMPSAVQERASASGKASTEEGEENGFWGKDGFSFGDLIDLVNPLQHIPFVSTIYRAITGDEIGIGPRLFGGAVLGGVIGFGISAANAALEYETGKDAGSHVLMAMGFAKGAETSVASAKQNESTVMLANATPQGASLPWLDSTAQPEESLQQLTEDQAVMLLLAQGNSQPASIAASSGAIHNATQRYQQTQVIDTLQKVALTMDVKS